jgi:hypothetical protein
MRIRCCFPVVLEVLPDVFTVGEFLLGYEASGSFGLGVPKITPAKIIDKLYGDQGGHRRSKIQGAACRLRPPALPGSPADFGKLIAKDTEKWGNGN